MTYPMKSMTQGMKLMPLAFWRRGVTGLLCVLIAFALFPRTASAHPMGNFSTNRYSRVTVGSDGVELLYIVDMAEIPTHAERSAMDTNGDDEISAQEEQSYLESVAATLRTLVERGLRTELRQAASRRAKPAKIAWVTVDGGLPPDIDVKDRAAMVERLRRR